MLKVVCRGPGASRTRNFSVTSPILYYSIPMHHRKSVCLSVVTLCSKSRSRLEVKERENTEILCHRMFLPPGKKLPREIYATRSSDRVADANTGDQYVSFP